jgi:hypothetical protein
MTREESPPDLENVVLKTWNAGPDVWNLDPLPSSYV